MNEAIYTVGSKGFDSFFAAVAYAKANDLEVVETATGVRRWHKATKPATKKVAHVLVNADGSETAIGKVRQ